jgi:GntR family transcriptional regulator, transcriptional repressor for pyruvate dehydrogenase complex
LASPQDPPLTSDPTSRLIQRRQVKLSDEVYEAVLTDIVQRRYPEGTKLPTETTLAQEFKVSRPVVREALARLRDDGLIEPRQGAGSFVLKRPGSALLRFAPIGSIADIQRCFEFRITVEPNAARLAAVRRDDKGLDTIKAALEALDEAITLGTVDVASDFAFHKAVAEASGNSYFTTTLHSLEQSVKTAMLLNRQLSLLNPLERLNLVQAEHSVVYRTILDKDGDAAFDGMLSHIQKSRSRIFDGGAPI